MSIRFDWYQATVRADLPPAVILDRIAAELAGADRVDHRQWGMNGYSKSAVLLDRDERILVTMQHSGNRGAPPNLYASGPDTPAFADTVRQLRLSHELTRADACADLEGEDFDQVSGQVRSIAKSHGVKGKTDLPDNPEEGATYYVGAPTSAIRCRVYRKDLEMIAKGVSVDEFPQPIVRVEAQIRPKGPSRRALAQVEPGALFGCSRWLRAISSTVLEGNPAAIVMQKREPTVYDRQVAWLKTQGKGCLSAIYARHPSHELLGKFLVEEVINSC